MRRRTAKRRSARQQMLRTINRLPEQNAKGDYIDKREMRRRVAELRDNGLGMTFPEFYELLESPPLVRDSHSDRSVSRYRHINFRN